MRFSDGLSLKIIALGAIFLLSIASSAAASYSSPAGRNSSLSASSAFADLSSVAHRAAPADPPGCSGQGCPTGVVDYGIGPSGNRYSYSAQDVQGFIDFASINITSGMLPSGSCIDPDAGVNGTQCFSVQLNWVMHNVRDGRNKLSNYLAQDVAEIAYDPSCVANQQFCLNDTFSVTFISNVWNLTAKSAGMVSRFTGNLEHDCSSISTGLFYGCVSSTYYGVTTPFSLWSGMTIGPSSGGTFGPCKAYTVNSCVGFYGAIIKNNQPRGPGYFDGLAFNNTKTSSPKFYVSGKSTPAVGGDYDAEWVLGACCGSDVSLNVSATMQEEYSVQGASGTYVDIKNAWTFGMNTAEGVVGVYMFADYGVRSTATVSNNPPTQYNQTILW